MIGNSSASVALPTAQACACPKGTRFALALSCMINVRLPNLSLPWYAAGSGALHASAPHLGYDSAAAIRKKHDWDIIDSGVHAFRCDVETLP